MTKIVVCILKVDDSYEKLLPVVKDIVSNYEFNGKKYITSKVDVLPEPFGISMGYVDNCVIKSFFKFSLSLIGVSWCNSSDMLSNIRIDTITSDGLTSVLETIRDAFKLDNNDEAEFLLQLLSETM